MNPYCCNHDILIAAMVTTVTPPILHIKSPGVLLHPTTVVYNFFVASEEAAVI